MSIYAIDKENQSLDKRGDFQKKHITADVYEINPIDSIFISEYDWCKYVSVCTALDKDLTYDSTQIVLKFPNCKNNIRLRLNSVGLYKYWYNIDVVDGSAHITVKSPVNSVYFEIFPAEVISQNPSDQYMGRMRFLPNFEIDASNIEYNYMEINVPEFSTNTLLEFYIKGQFIFLSGDEIYYNGIKFSKIRN